MPTVTDKTVTISTGTFTRMDDARMRLQRIERDLGNLANDIEGQISGDVEHAYICGEASSEEVNKALGYVLLRLQSIVA